jgi:uncharacterized protein YecE (DUF72 family)
MKNLYVGTCSWNHKGWLGKFYPEGMYPQAYLSHYAKTYKTVEVDATWYEIPEKSIVERWKEITPRDFIFSLKVPRIITHQKMLEGCENELVHFLSIVKILNEKLGVLLFQFPSYFDVSQMEIFIDFLRNLPGGLRFAVEFRNRSWFVERTYEILGRYRIGLVLLDKPDLPKLSIVTSDFAYIRCIGDHKKMQKHRCNEVILDRKEEIIFWAEKVKNFLTKGIRVYSYFNNHYAGYAPDSCKMFLDAVTL